MCTGYRSLVWVALLYFVAVASHAYEPPGHILFGGDQVYSPLEWAGENQVKGFNIELASELAHIGGSKADHRLAVWADTMRALEEGKLDVVPMFYSVERSYKFIFIQAYYYIPHAIYALPELAEWLQDTLSTASANGAYQTIYERWQSRLEPVESGNHWLYFFSSGFALLLTVVAVGGCWYWSLRRRVTLHTRALAEALAQRELAEQELRRVANFDVQTGLAKLPYFIEQLDDYFHAHQQPVTQEKEILVLKLVDLDVVVRTFGFARAEMIVNVFAAHLLALENTFAAYLGRGVFALFINRCEVLALFNRLAHELAASEPGFNSQFVGGSAYWPAQARSATKLMRHAETALAMSEVRGRRWLAYEIAMEPSRIDLDIVAIFIDGNVQGLYPVFQPQLDLRSGKILSAEVLVRWHHPRLGLVPPDVFIPLLEKSGLIEQITAQMIDEAVRVAVLLRKRRLPCCISVNVAAYDLIETNLVDIVRQALVQYQGLPSDIKLELTETSVASDPQQVKKILGDMSELGVYASVDDFGTGYSSLSYLSLFPIRELKIDRSFVMDMLDNPRNHSIVRSTILMARELGLVTVAEGVEDDQTLQMLKKNGCDIAQGYVISRPLPEAEFIDYMRAHAAQVFDISQFMKE